MYKFKLESLLEHRKFIEETVQKELSQIKRRLIEEQNALDRLYQKEKAVNSNLEHLKQRPLASSELIMHNQYLTHLNQAIEKQKRVVHSVEKSLDSKHDELTEAMKKRQTLEKLKEKGLNAYKEKIFKQEQDFINEVAIGRYNMSR